MTENQRSLANLEADLKYSRTHIGFARWGRSFDSDGTMENGT